MSSLPNSVDAFKAYVIDLVERPLSWRRPEFEGVPMKFTTESHLNALLAENGRHFDQLLAIDHVFRSLLVTQKRDFQIMAMRDKSLVFLITLHSGISTPSLLAILQTPSFRDATLPFTAEQRPAAVPTSGWGSFMSSQELLAPLHLSMNSFDMQSSCIPIHGSFETGEGASEGTGQLFLASISGAYHNFPNIEHGKGIILLKAIENESDADREKGIVKEISALPTSQQTHIAKTFARFTFTKNGSYYLFGEPEEHYLDEFMFDNPDAPRPDHINLPWLLAQFRGLANAVHTIHTGVPGKTIVHHNIKPDNILVFTDPTTKHKVLRIADWSSATSAPHEPNTAPGSPRSRATVHRPYYAPECRNNGASSRKHDVWSLGCVFLEVLIWWTRGWQYLGEQRVLREECDDEGFWGNGIDEMSYEVRDELEWLGENGFESMAKVIEEMLRFDEGERLTAGEVARRI